MMKYFFIFLLVGCLSGCKNNSSSTISRDLDDKISGDTVVLYCDEEVVSVVGGETINYHTVFSHLDSYPALAEEFYVNLKTAEPINATVIKDYTSNDFEVYYIIRKNSIDTIRAYELRGRYITEAERDAYIEIYERWKK